MPQLQHPSTMSYVIDKSQYVPAASGLSTTIFTTATRGPVNVPVSITSVGQLETVFGPADYSKGTYGLYAAKQVLTETNQIWVVRVEATSTAGGMVLPTKGVISVEDGSATPKQLFVATAASEGEWFNKTTLNVYDMTIHYGATRGAWTASAAYSIGDVVTAVTPNGLSFRAVTAGTAGAVEPTWPTTVGATVVDGGVTWEAIAPTVTVSFDITLDGVAVVETHANVDISQITSVRSDYMVFTAGTGAAPFTVPATLPATYSVHTAGGTLGADNVNNAANPYVNTATVAGWISTSIAAGTMRDENLYPTAILIAPGYCNASTVETLAVWNDLVSLAKQRGDCIVIPEISRGQTAAGAVAERGTVGVPSDPQFSANPYYPWLKEYDPVLRQSIILPPSGYIAAVYHYNDRVGEIWTAPAGLERGVVRGPEGFEDGAQVDSGSQDILFPGGVNAITFDPALRVMYVNAQKTATMLPSKMDRVHVARLVTTIQKAVIRYAESFRFRPNDPETWNDIRGGVESYLADIQARRGLEAFRVICDATTNTPARRDRNELWLELHIIPMGAAEFIYIPITIHRSGTIK